MTIRWQTTPFTDLGIDELYAVLHLRQEVFVVEQECAYLDLDYKDQVATHMLCSSGVNLLAYQRCLPPGVSYAESSLGRIVVHPSIRGEKLGRDLVRRGIEHNRARWPEAGVCISAQAQLQRFYESLGFEVEGDEYLEDGLPHLKMRISA